MENGHANENGNGSNGVASKTKNGEQTTFPLTKPTRSYLVSTSRERFIGGLGASMFSVIYYFAPAYLAGTTAALLAHPKSRIAWTFALPVAVSFFLPRSVVPAIGKFLLQTHVFRSIPKYFRYEEFHEFTDNDFAEFVRGAPAKRYIFCCHPHGVFPFVATCALCAATGAPSDHGRSTYPYQREVTDDMPTAVASVLRAVPLLKDIVGLFNVIDASGAVLAKRLKQGCFALYVGGMLEIFLSSPTREVVFLRKRKGFIKLALRNGADVIPIYMFGNTTCLSALASGPLASLSRRLGVSCTVFWGRWGLPIPRPTKLVYARGRPVGLPHIPHPTDADVDKWHRVYCERLLELFDNYKRFNPDYAAKTLVIE